MYGEWLYISSVISHRQLAVGTYPATKTRMGLINFQSITCTKICHNTHTYESHEQWYLSKTWGHDPDDVTHNWVQRQILALALLTNFIA